MSGKAVSESEAQKLPLEISVSPSRRKMNEILREMKIITGRIGEENEDEKCVLEWKFAAQVLDT